MNNRLEHSIKLTNRLGSGMHVTVVCDDPLHHGGRLFQPEGLSLTSPFVHDCGRTNQEITAFANLNTIPMKDGHEVGERPQGLHQ